MTCTLPSRRFGLSRGIAAPRSGAHPAFIAALVGAAASLAWLFLLFVPVAQSAPKPLRSEDPSLVGAVDSVHTSILTVIAYPPPDPSQRPGARRTRHIGTAVALSENRILTTASIAIPGGSVRVLLSGGIERPAILRGVDHASNIALFQVEGATLRALKPAPPQSLAIGAWVAVISNVSITRPQAALGKIVGRGERIDYPHSGEILEIDAPSYPGSTGAAVLNEDGDWVALIVGRAAPMAPSGGIGSGQAETTIEPGSVLIALPVDQVTWLAKELETYGSARRGFLGIQLRRGGPSPSESLGVLVANVIPGSPADSAGLRPGDRILALDGDEAHTADELTARVRATRPSDVIQLTVLRQSEIFPIRAVVGASFAEPPVGPRLAAEQDLTRLKQEVLRLGQEKHRLEEQIRQLESNPRR